MESAERAWGVDVLIAQRRTGRGRRCRRALSLKMASSFTAVKCEMPLQHAARAGDRSMSTDHVSFPSTVQTRHPKRETSGARKLGPRGRILYLRLHNFFPPNLFLFSSTRPF